MERQLTYNYIPLTNSLIANHLPKLYIFGTMMRHQLELCIPTFASSTLFLRLNDDFMSSRKACGMHRNNFYPAAKSIELEQLYQGEFISLMPHKVWDKFSEFLKRYPMRSRNSFTKLYLYIWHNSMAHTKSVGFYHSAEELAAALNMGRNEISEKTKILVENEFILITVQHNHILHRARSFSVPDDDWSL